MKILIVSQYFWPEPFRINDLAIALKNKGHEVTVLTGKPNYPEGKIYNGYKFGGFLKEDYDGVEIIRVPLIPRGNGSGLRLAINYLSYVAIASLYVLLNKRKFDVSLTFAISPITQIYPALLHKKLYKSKACLWVQDLWPESVSAAGKVKKGTVYNILDKMVEHIYINTDKILIQSEAFYDSIKSKIDSDEKVSYVPNWAEDLFLDSKSVDKAKYKNLIPEGFIIMFAGNIGEAQDFDSIIKAAELTKENKEIKWVIVGDGRKRKFVESEVQRLGLTDTFFLLGRYPVEEMTNFFVHADIMLLTLKDEYIFSLTIPSKVQSYMAFGKPILAMINGIGEKVIQESGCGYVASAGDYIQLAQNAHNAYKESKDSLYEKGKNGKIYYNNNFEKEKILDNLIDIFNK